MCLEAAPDPAALRPVPSCTRGSRRRGARAPPAQNSKRQSWGLAHRRHSCESSTGLSDPHAEFSNKPKRTDTRGILSSPPKIRYWQGARTGRWGREKCSSTRHVLPAREATRNTGTEVLRSRSPQEQRFPGPLVLAPRSIPFTPGQGDGPPQNGAAAMGSPGNSALSTSTCSSALSTQDRVPCTRQRHEDYFPHILLIAEEDELGPGNHRLHGASLQLQPPLHCLPTLPAIHDYIA